MVALNDIYEVKYCSFYDAQIALNIRHWRVGQLTAPGATDQEVADALCGDYGTAIKPLLATPAAFLGCSVRNITLIPLPVSVTATVGAGFGTAGALALPTQTCGMITLRTTLAGRANRGRVYVPFPATDELSAQDRPTAAYVVDLNVLGVKLTSQRVIVGAGGSTTLDPVIHHRLTGTSTALVGFTPRQLWATQRRRGDYGRENPQSIPA